MYTKNRNWKRNSLIYLYSLHFQFLGGKFRRRAEQRFDDKKASKNMPVKTTDITWYFSLFLELIIRVFHTRHARRVAQTTGRCEAEREQTNKFIIVL